MVMVTVENPVGGRRSKLGLTQVLGLKSPEKTGSSSPKNSKMMGGFGVDKNLFVHFDALLFSDNFDDLCFRCCIFYRKKEPRCPVPKPMK